MLKSVCLECVARGWDGEEGFEVEANVHEDWLGWVCE